MKAEGELEAIAPDEEENIPKSPNVRHDGHGKDDDAFHGNGDVVNITGNGKDRGDNEEKDGWDNDARHVGAQINVLIHKTSRFTGDTATPG
jgi:hypothetical protein